MDGGPIEDPVEAGPGKLDGPQA